MSDFAAHVDDYLRLRRGLGFKLEFPGHVLPQLVDYLDAGGEQTLTTQLAIAWAGLPRDVKPISLAHRLGAARGFAKYLQTIDPATEIPPCGIWPSTAPRPLPVVGHQHRSPPRRRPALGPPAAGRHPRNASGSAGHHRFARR